MNEIHIVFDGPPGPESGRFVEVEDENGNGMSVGEWRERPDGLWALVMQPDAEIAALRADNDSLSRTNRDFDIEIMRLRERAETAEKDRDEANATIARLGFGRAEADNDRLREALEEIAASEHIEGCEGACPVEIANAALAASDPKEIK